MCIRDSIYTHSLSDHQHRHHLPRHRHCLACQPSLPLPCYYPTAVATASTNTAAIATAATIVTTVEKLLPYLPPAAPRGGVIEEVAEELWSPRAKPSDTDVSRARDKAVNNANAIAAAEVAVAWQKVSERTRPHGLFWL
eukprot:1330432-Pleurochrysis_carterae.AAC.1